MPPIGWLTRYYFLQSYLDVLLFIMPVSSREKISKLYHTDDVKEWLSLPPPEDNAGAVSQASLAAVFIVVAPFTMVKLSVFSFLLGLVIYQGFVWTRRLDSTAAAGDSRKIFITFVVANGTCLLFFLLTFSAKSIESLLRIGRTSDESIAGQGHDGSERYPSQQSSLKTPMAGTEVQEPINPGSNAEHLQTSSTQRGHIPMTLMQKPMDTQIGSASRPTNGLASALQYAAQAHVQCADADRLVASEYAKLSLCGKGHDRLSVSLNHSGKIA